MLIPHIENPKPYRWFEELKEADPQPEGRAVHRIALGELGEFVDKGMVSGKRQFVEKTGLAALASSLLLGNPALLKEAV